MTEMLRRIRIARAICGVLLCLLLAAPAAPAQSGRSTVRGTVRDQQGNVVAGATVTLADAERNFTRTQTSNDEGGYTFASIPPGTYRVEVESTGFKKVSVSDVQALVDTPVDVDIELQPGLATESVTVTASNEAPLNTTDATIGNAFESRRIEELPLNARNVVGLLSLQPGVTRGGYVNGGRADQANVTLDGVDNNEQQRGLDVVTDEAFASVLRSTPDSLQEFRVITSNANAEQGRSSGAQVSLITKSGTNEWHGSVYEFHRNTVTTANDFFNNAAGSFGPDDFAVQTGAARVGDPRAPRPQLLRNVFGGSVGGPIKRDKAFFFFTYEGFREASETPVVREVPLPTLGQGIVRYFTANGDSDPGCPAGTPEGVNCLTPAEINAAYAGIYGASPGLNPAALAVLASAANRYPANDASVGDGLNTSGFRFNAKTPASLNTFITRMDFNLTDRQTLFLRGNYQQDNVTKGTFFATDCSDSAQCFPDTEPLTIWNHPYGVAVGHTWTASNTLVNRFTYGLTRTAFSDFGDTTLPGGNGNFTTFRFIYRPTGYRSTLFRTTPVHNIVEDVSWIKGTHTLQFGGNIRFIRNNRTSFAGAFDEAVINPSWYDFSGAVLTRDSYGDNASLFPSVAVRSDLRDALAAVIGRFSQYSANLTYDAGGQLQSAGAPTLRTFATEEYELYWQDSWRWRPNLTLTYGLRWSTGTPVYEKNGVQVKPTVSLGDYFARRQEGAAAGQPLNEPITLDRAGKANGRPGYYEQDWNNFAPSIAVAWSPDFGDNFFGRLLGRNGRSVIRGGFRMTYDRIGSQLAANFDLNSALGYTSSLTIGANTFNVSDSLAPLFGGFSPDVRSFPVSPGTITPTLTFPLTLPSDEAQRIEQSLDDSLTTPSNYSFNVTYGRELGKGLSFEAGYVGRLGRDLLASRDIMHLNNLRDPESGMTWYEAINTLIDHRYAFTPIDQVPTLPYFENLFPGINEFLVGVEGLSNTQALYLLLARPEVGGADITDYTFLQSFLDDQPVGRLNNAFFHPQFAALSVFSTIARSNYHSGQFSLRHRFRNDVAFDFNYTLAHSLDSASGLQSATAYSTAGFIVNALDPDQNYASSDFDVRHIINANWLVSLPFGRGRWLGNNLNGVANAVLGDWQLSGIFRWNTGLPIQTPFQADRWATNWNVQSNMVRACAASSSPTRQGSARVFTNQDAVFRCWREPRAGEVGDRNIMRGEGYMSIDMGLTKNFKMPWEGHNLQFRWEVFNVTNSQYFDNNSLQGLGLVPDPFLPDPDSGEPLSAPSDFGTYTATQTPLNEPRAGRVMQFALRYTF
ncbi:MAG TPA: TonB-dependent receptor [Pyrinomonadaceae bacterium]|nr:TonB-dependent receptor [Pyrinomonadaceae bacterium]